MLYDVFWYGVLTQKLGLGLKLVDDPNTILKKIPWKRMISRPNFKISLMTYNIFVRLFCD